MVVRAGDTAYVERPALGRAVLPVPTSIDGQPGTLSAYDASGAELSCIVVANSGLAHGAC